MHPALSNEIARYYQADLLREAARERMAREATTDREGTRRRWPRRSVRSASKPAFGR